MRRRGRAAAAARAVAWALLLAAGCVAGGPRRPAPREPALRIWVPAIVRWEGGRREVALDVENGTDRTVRVEAPGPRRVRVTLFVGSGPDRACGVEPDAEAPPGEAVAVAPGEAIPVRVDLARACARLAPGEYRYEIAYEAPAVGDGPPLKLRARHGHVVVSPSARALERGALGSGAASPAR